MICKNGRADMTYWGLVLIFILFQLFLFSQSVFSASRPDTALLKKKGVKFIKATSRFGARSGEQKFYEMHISLAGQVESGVLSEKPKWQQPRKRLPGVHTLILEDFERLFPGRDWQVLASGARGGWRTTAFRSVSGSFSAVCAPGAADATVRPVYANNSVSWLINGPFSLKHAEKASLNFYQYLDAQLDADILFWGVSVDGDEFYGFGASGHSEDWQFVSLDLNDVPVIGRVAGKSSVWFAFCFLSDTTAVGEGAFIDRVHFARDYVWRQEFSATIDGRLNLNAYSGGIGLSKPALADLDDDGDLDLVLGEYDGVLNFYRNDGTRYHPKWTLVDCQYGGIDVGDNSAPVFCDVDGDLDLDLLVGDAAGFINYFENIGNSRDARWSFGGRLKSANKKIINVRSTSAPALADLNGDGLPELVIGNGDGFLAYYRRQSEQEAWSAKSGSYFNIDVGSLSAPAFADIDGDGDLDMFTGVREETLYYYENTGDVHQEKFHFVTKAFDSLRIGAITAPFFADIDSDKDFDLFVGEARGEVTFFENNGTAKEHRFNRNDGVKLDLQTIDVGFQCAPVLVDLDQDRDLDLVLGAADGKFYFYRNVGTASKPAWQKDDDYFATVRVKAWSTPAFVDIDADGDYDLVTGSKFGRLSMFKNEGTSAHPEWRRDDALFKDVHFRQQSFPTLGDIDADGDFDLFVGTSSDGISFIENTGSKTAPEWTLRTTNFLNLKHIVRPAPRLVDIDGDGDFDLFLGTKTGRLVFIENTGTVRKAKWSVVSREYNNIDVRFFTVPAFGDIDGDGDPDLFVGTNGGGLYFWRNLSGALTTIEFTTDLGRKRQAAAYALQPHPLPFDEASVFEYRLNYELPVSLQIYDLNGRLVATLVQRRQGRGAHVVNWPGLDSKDGAVRDGLYFAAFGFGKTRVIRKLLFIRSGV